MNCPTDSRLCAALWRTLLALLLAACAASAQAQTVGSRDIYVGKGMFGEIIVSDDAKGLRTLQFERGGGRHSMIKPGDPAHLELEYTRIALVALALCAQPPARVLVVGLGGGTLPLFLRAAYPNVRIDVAEIDPAVVSAAERYFGLVQDERLRAHVGDGRQFIERAAPASYDLIILDAFDAKVVPRHLTTQEFLRAVRAALRPDGVAVSNIWGPRFNAAYYPMLATYRSVFEELYIVAGLIDANVMTFALPRSARLSREQLAARARALYRPPVLRYELGEMVEKGWIDAVAESSGGAVLRD